MPEPDKKNGKWQDFVDHCFDLYDEIDKSEYRDAKIETIKESYRVYQQNGKKTSFPWKDASNVILPMHAITVDNLEPRLWSGLIGKKPVIQLSMEGMTEQDDETRVVQDWFNSELEQVVGIDKLAGTVVHKALLEGTVYPIVEYDEDEKTTRDFKFDDTGHIIISDETGEPLTEDVTVKLFEGGKVSFAKFSDIYVADDAEDWDNADVIRKVRPTYGELMELADKKGYIKKNIGPDLLSEKSDSDDQDPSPDTEGDMIKITGKEVIECLECHVSYVMRKEGQTDEDIKDWTSERYVALITEGTKTLIRILPLMDLNFKNEHMIKRVRLYREDGKAYGTSIYEKIRSIQDGASDLFNMVVNVATVTMIPWFMYTDKAGMEANAVITPGKGIKVDDTSQILFPKFNQNPRSYIVFIEMFMSLWEKLGSIGDIQIGRLSESRKDATATETMAAIQEGNIKHNYQSISLKEDFLAVLKTVYDLYYQFTPMDKKTLLHGKTVLIPKNSMRRKYKFRLVGSTDLSNKVLEIQKTQQLYQTLRPDPLANPMQLIEDLIMGFKPDSEPTKYINPQLGQIAAALPQNPELPQVIQKYLQEKAQQQQQGGQQQQQNPQDPMAQLELAAKQEDIKKTQAEEELIKAKTESERVNQQAKGGSIRQGDEKLRIDKSKIFADLIKNEAKNARPANNR